MWRLTDEQRALRKESDVSWCAYVEELAKVSGTVSLMAAEGLAECRGAGGQAKEVGAPA